ncbi:helicase C-terminal domain-containing protein [Streptomyces sp. 21So2-11]|uniref:helicase C-terminal domain-containing protein n=1 Tax=Streptomyces sp. 21So2-11 TaxID=3144408 RepID=UPI00321B35DB
MISINTSHGSPLTAWLRTLTPNRLRLVLASRPDAVRSPEPRTLGELADRLQRPASVALALPRLTLPALQTAEALAVLPPPVSRTELAELLDATSDALTPELDSALRQLTDLALVWRDSQGDLRMVTPLRTAWESPLGLHPGLAELLTNRTSEELRTILTTLNINPPGTKPQRLAALLEHHSDANRLATLLAAAPARARRLLEQHADPTQEPPAPTMHGSPRPDTAERWALDRALLVKPGYGYEPARMPAEVSLALRGPGWHAPFAPAPPEPALAELTAAEVGREATAAATAFAGQAATLLAECAGRPPARLKSGGVGARELARIGKVTQCEEPVVRLALECAYAAGLLAHDGDRTPVTVAYDAWSEQEPAERLTLLLHAWWMLGLTPSSARDEDGKALPALDRPPSCASCRQARHGLLTAAAGLPSGQGVQKSAALGELITWHRPLTHQLPQDTTPFSTLIREAELLGVLARGALSPLGEALLSDDTSAVRTCATRLLPSATATAHIGADLTAVVSGTPTAQLATLLDTLANREARGTASVWRFSPASMRRALDAGRTADDIESALTAVAENPLPQPLSYLITDTARRHGRIRLASAACVIHSTEPPLLAEIAAHRTLSKLGLRQLAPTVLLSRTSPAKTLEALRAEGYAPVAEAADGTVRIEKPPHLRATHLPLPHPRRTTTTTPHSTPPDPLKLASTLLAAPDREPYPDPYNGVPFATDTEEILDHYAKDLSLTDRRQLAHAIHEQEPLTIEYVAQSGSHTIRTVSELEFDPPYLYAYCHLREDDRVFTLSRIQAVMPAQ